MLILNNLILFRLDMNFGGKKVFEIFDFKICEITIKLCFYFIFEFNLKVGLFWGSFYTDFKYAQFVLI